MPGRSCRRWTSAGFGPARRFREVGDGAGREQERTVPAFWYQPRQGLQVAAPLSGERAGQPSPGRTALAMEAEVLRVRAQSNNAWGARKIARILARAGHPAVPAASTITVILRRYSRVVADGLLGGTLPRRRAAAIRSAWSTTIRAMRWGWSLWRRAGRLAVADADGQRRAVGRRGGSAVHHVHRLADPW